MPFFSKDTAQCTDLYEFLIRKMYGHYAFNKQIGNLGNFNIFKQFEILIELIVIKGLCNLEN